MFEQTFKNIDDVLRKEAGCTTELDYTEQTSWILFLKYLDELEGDREIDAELRGKAYAPIIDAEHRWSVWAAPKDAQGKFDHNRALPVPTPSNIKSVRYSARSKTVSIPVIRCEMPSN